MKRHTNVISIQHHAGWKKAKTISTDPPKINVNVLAPLASFFVSDIVETLWNPIENKVLNWAG